MFALKPNKKKHNRIISCSWLPISLFILACIFSAFTSYQETIVDISQNTAFPDFPDAIDFSLIGTASQPIERAFLTYGSNGRSCTQTKNEIELTFDPTEELNLTANWDVTQGSIFPRGASYWWQWTLIDTAGNEIELERQDAIFVDSWFVWESSTLENVTISWYRGGEDYALELLDQAILARENLARDTGLLLTEPVDFYLFNDPRDLGRSLPGAPSWAGGVAFPEHNVMMVAANTNSEQAAEYGRLTTKHEFGHLVIGNLTFNCLTNLPTWLNEGLAQVAEGPAEQRSINLVTQAVADGQVASLTTLEGSFSIHGERASLSYAQSDQITRFLLDQWGNDGMLLLLETITQGNTIDDALQIAYGHTQFEIENMWRAEIGAELLTAVEDAQKSAEPAPTLSLLTIPTTLPPTSVPTEIPTETDTPMPTLEPTVEKTEASADTQTEQIATVVVENSNNNQPIDNSNVTQSANGGSKQESSANSTSPASRQILYFSIAILLCLIIGGAFLIYSKRQNS